MSQNTDTEFTDSKFYSNFKTSTDSQIGEIRFVINIVNLFNFSPTQASSVLAIIVLDSFVYIFRGCFTLCTFTFM